MDGIGDTDRQGCLEARRSRLRIYRQGKEIADRERIAAQHGGSTLVKEAVDGGRQRAKGRPGNCGQRSCGCVDLETLERSYGGTPGNVSEAVKELSRRGDDKIERRGGGRKGGAGYFRGNAGGLIDGKNMKAGSAESEACRYSQQELAAWARLDAAYSQRERAAGNLRQSTRTRIDRQYRR